MDKTSLETLSDRLRYALKETGTRSSFLAKQLCISPQTMRYLRHGKVRHSRYTYQIANALAINPRWLAEGEGEMFESLPPNFKIAPSFPPVPLLALSEIPGWHAGEHQQTVRAHPETEWLIPTSNLGPHGFACRINDKALFPRFDLNTVVFVHPDLEPHPHGFVVAYLSEINDVMIRQYEQDSYPTSFLKPLNTKFYNTVNLTSHDKILGVIVEARWHI